MKERVYPLCVSIEGGEYTAALMSPKGYSKSREQGTLWITHPETGRILPWQGEPAFVELAESNNGYRAVLPRGTNPQAIAFVKDTVDVESHDEVGAEKEAVPGAGKADFLSILTKTIAQRHRDMPEGSYTTHLFSKGMDKIKKKTGEEAVELLLAREKNDILYESADLIYHLLVLLEAANLSIFDVLAELEKRDS
jgi:phosphoribosyl-ATP pyrophosphohydrolase